MIRFHDYIECSEELFSLVGPVTRAESNGDSRFTFFFLYHLDIVETVPEEEDIRSCFESLLRILRSVPFVLVADMDNMFGIDSLANSLSIKNK